MKKRRRPSAGRFIIIVLLALLTLYGLFIGPLRALTNDIVLGGLLNLAAAFAIMAVFFYVTLWLAGPHVLPVNPRDRHENAAARNLLRRFATGGYVAMAVVRDGAVEPGPHGESREQIGGYGVIDVDSTSVVDLHTAVGPSRIKGTGLVFPHESEHLANIVDLRVQVRSQEFEYMTRDGIPLKARLSMRFQMDQATFNKNLHAHDPKLPLPAPISWSIHPIARALAKLQVVDGGGPVTSWSDLPLLYANGMLRPVISEYRFDDLVSPADPTRDPRKEIREQITARLKPVLMRQGVKMLGLGIGLFLPQGFDSDKTFDQEKPELDEITAQRIKAWKAEWESRMIKLNAEAQAEAERRYAIARTQAQMELIMRVTQALEQGAPVTLGNQDLIAKRFLETLEKLAREPYTRARLSEDNIVVLGRYVDTQGQLSPHEQVSDKTAVDSESAGNETALDSSA
jgi:hypothetical protein